MRTTKHILILLILATVLLNSAHAKLYPTVDDPFISGEFMVAHYLDPMSDEVVSIMILSGEFLGGVGGRLPCFGVGLRISASSVYISYEFGKYLVGDRDREVLVRYRVGKNPASRYQYWQLFGSDRDMAMVNMGLDEARELFANMVESDEIIFEVTDPYDRELIRDTFSLRGFETALAKALSMLAALKGEQS